MRTNKETKNVKERMRGLTYNQQGVHKKNRSNREIEEGAVLKKGNNFFLFFLELMKDMNLQTQEAKLSVQSDKSK